MLNEELVKELEKRDAAVDEAANIIHEQDERFKALQSSIPRKAQARRTDNHQDSDYYSAEPEIPDTPATDGKVRRGSSSGSSIVPAESDYYSATSYSSPASAAPRTPKTQSRRSKPVPVAKSYSEHQRSKESVQNSEDQPQPFGDHIPLRVSSAKTAIQSSIALAQQTSSLESSPDSLTPRPSLRRSRRTQAAAIAGLRLQDQQETAQPAAGPQPSAGAPRAQASSQRTQSAATPPPTHGIPRSSSEPPQEWNSSRPLRSLHMTGELNRPVTTDANSSLDLRLRAPGEAPPNATPSVLDVSLSDDESQTATSTARLVAPRERNSTGRMSSARHAGADELSDGDHHERQGPARDARPGQRV